MRRQRAMRAAIVMLAFVMLVFGVFSGTGATGGESAPATPPEPVTVEYIQAHYTKYEYRVPMRDGVRLFTSVYAPKDHSRKYPFLLTRTPYSCKPYGIDQFPAKLGPSEHFARSGYIFVKQDVRGRWNSEGEFVNMRPHRTDKRSPRDIDESTDTYDTIDWLLKHVPGHNGRAGQWGVSYPGFYTSCGLIDAHSALKAASPQAPICDWFVGDDWHHNGALQLAHAFNFLANFGRPRPEPTKKFDFKFDHGTPDGYRFFLDLGPLRDADPKHFHGQVAYWNEVLKHGTYDDYWQARNLRPHLKNVRPAVLVVCGWFDAENLFGGLETYRAIERTSPKSANSLVMGPWVHGGWSSSDGASLGDIAFRAKTAEFYREKIEFPFFEHYLKDQGTGRRAEAQVFQTGTNEWREFAAWPPAEARPRDLFLRSDGRLAFAAPPVEEREAGFDEYLSDPRRPVPFVDKIDIGMLPEYMVADQRFAERRPDVLTYRTDVLEEDLAVVGPIEVELHVATTGTDADWVVKLIDVYPEDLPDPQPNPRGVRLGGYQQLVRGDVFRGKFRESLSRPVPFEPNQPAKIAFTLPDICHVFRPGHRLMVQVQSTWFPLIDRNPQRFVDIYSATDRDFRSAQHRVFRTPERATRLRLLTLP